MVAEANLHKKDESRGRKVIATVLLLLLWLAVPATAFGIAILVLNLSDSIGYSLLIAYAWVALTVAVLTKIFNRRTASRSDFISPRDGEQPPMAGEKALVWIAFVGFIAVCICRTSRN